jgi:hypothetical protein
MSHYFFDTDYGSRLHRDEIGTDLPDDQAARDEGIHAMAEMGRDYIPNGTPQKNITMWVRNEKGDTILHLALSFAVREVRS